MKKIFLLGFAALCAMTMNAQIMRVHSGGTVIFEKNVDAIEQVTFSDASSSDVSVAFKNNFITLEKEAELNLADILITNNVAIADVTVTTSNAGVVAITDGKLVAKNYGSAVITATATNALAPARLYVAVEAGFMYIEDVFTITGRGTVATGTILSGKFKEGEEVILGKLSDDAEDITTYLTGIEMFRKSVEEASAGENVGFLLRGVEKSQVSRGDVIMSPQNTAIVKSKKIRATVYVLTKDEGGRHTPFFANYRPQLNVGGVDVTVNVTDLGTQDGSAVEMVMPGTTSDNMILEVQDAVTPFTFRGQQCVLREGGKTVARVTITGY